MEQHLSFPTRIAIADDHYLMRKGLATLLHEIGNIKICAEASHGKELIEQLSILTEDVEICIVDAQMPVMNGYETLIRIKDKWPKTKVLILSVFTENIYVWKMWLAGADAYLPKDCDPEKLKEALTAIKQNNTYFNDLINPAEMRNSKGKVRIPDIKPKEEQLLTYIGTDMPYHVIAQKMHTTPRSIEGLRDSLFEKFKVNSRQGLTRLAIGLGYIPVSGVLNPFNQEETQ